MLENALIFARVAAGMLKHEATSWQHQARGGLQGFHQCMCRNHGMLEREIHIEISRNLMSRDFSGVHLSRGTEELLHLKALIKHPILVVQQ